MIEMLLATILVGVLTTLSVMTFQAVTHGWQASTDYMDNLQRTDYALNQIISGLRSMYYPHDGQQNDKYGFVLMDKGDGDRPDKSDIIEWSKTGPAIVGTKNQIADTVHRVQVMVLEEGNHDYETPIQKTGLYARLCSDTAIIPSSGDEQSDDDTDYSFGNEELYQPVLISDGVVGMNCRVIKSVDDMKGGIKNSGENSKKDFEDEFAESNAVPYKVELTLFVERKDNQYSSQTRRAPVVRIVRIPIHEQSLDGAAPPGVDEKNGGKRKGTGKK